MVVRNLSTKYIGVGGNMNKVVRGFSELDVLSTWVSTQLPQGYFVLLKDIDLTAKTTQYWEALPKDVSSCFKEDYVVFCCDTEDQAHSLGNNIEFSFATPLVIIHGEIVNVPD